MARGSTQILNKTQKAVLFAFGFYFGDDARASKKPLNNEEKARERNILICFLLYQNVNLPQKLYMSTNKWVE